MDASILICTYNRAALLDRTLRYLNAAERPAGHELKIVVAANACSDSTLDLLRSYSEEPGLLPLRWIEVATPGKSHALNQAVPLLDTPLTIFVDDDHRVDRRFLCEAVHAAERHPEIDLFCGRILPDWDGSEPEWAHDTGSYRIYPLPVPRYDQGDKSRELTPRGPIPGGGNLFLRTELFARVGPFATDFGPVGHNLGGAEDLEWIKRALNLGTRLRYVPEVVQHHYVDTERLKLSYLMYKAFQRSASSVRLSNERRPVPLFAYRKSGSYLLRALFSLRWEKRRFFLVRLAAALGELNGYLHPRNALNTTDKEPTHGDEPQGRHS